MNISARYSIKDLEKLSGIKAHTLRIWEKRYSLFEPDRTETNIRNYSNEDLKRILSISILNKNGIKISKIALMSDAQIAAKVLELNLVKTAYEDLIANLIVGMIDMDEEYFEKMFNAGILRVGFEQTIQKVIFPFFERIGIMWQTGSINPAQEHFVSNIIRQKMIVAIDGLREQSTGHTGTAVLFLPENEMHEMSLLFYNYVLKSRKFKTIYLGQMVPVSDLQRVCEMVKPDFILSVFTNSYEEKDLAALLKSIIKITGRNRFFLSGGAILNYSGSLPPGVRLFRNLEEFLVQL